jgi:hypothetical protein
MRRQRSAVHVLHRDEREALFVSNLVDGADIRMIQCRRASRFFQQAFAGGRIGDAADDLDRDGPLERGVVGQKHGPHPAGAENSVDAIASQT